METRQFTTQEIIDAIRQNGYPQKIGGGYVEYGLGTQEIVAACAIGQAAINLGVFNTAWGIGRIEGALNTRGSQHCPVCRNFDTVTTIVIELNDVHEWTLTKIADWLDSL